MVENKILIPVDFTEASDKAIAFGIHIASKMHAGISLLHVFEDEDMTLQECEEKLRALSHKINTREDAFSDYICMEGSIFDVIPEIASKSGFRMMVLGAHGRKGLRQKFFGADIIKLLKRIPIPALVVQNNSVLPEKGFRTTIFPVGSHDAYERKIEAMIIIAGICDPEVHLYSISKPGFDQSEKLRENIKLAEERFTEKGIKYIRVDEDQSVFSVGFAKQTLLYAKEAGANMISIMVNPTQEYAYFADSDKEAIIMNDEAIPVLCTSDAKAQV
jgi:nucleotide-binding universal stress UspA family protein